MQKGSDGYYRHDIWYEGKAYPVRSKTQKELWKKVAVKEEQLRTGQIVTNDKTAVEKWCYDYIDAYKKPSVTPDTCQQLRSYVKNYIAPAIGKMRMKDVKSIDLQRVLNACAGQSASQANKLRNLIRGAFRQARVNKVILDNPAEDLTLPDTESGSHRPITEHERRHILALCETHRAGLWVLTMLYCGLRPGETMTLKWSDVQGSVLFVRTAAEGQTGAEKGTKTDAGVRKIPIPLVLRDRLQRAYAAAMDIPSADTAEQQIYVFTQPTTGRRHTHTSMRQMWRSFQRELDIAMGAQTFRGAIVPETSRIAGDLVPYCFRHTYGTDLQAAGVPINVAKELMGHSDISLTSRIYTHFSDEAFDNAAERIENYAQARGKTIIPMPVQKNKTEVS